MIGFELNINGKKVSAALENGVVSVILTKLSDELRNSIDLDFTGLNTHEKGNEELIDWYRSSLNLGDELMIKVIDVSENSVPIEVRKKKSEFKDEQKLRSYEALKEELENKGLI